MKIKIDKDLKKKELLLKNKEAQKEDVKVGTI